MGCRRRIPAQVVAGSGAAPEGCDDEGCEVMVSRSSWGRISENAPPRWWRQDGIAPQRLMLLYQASHPSCAISAHRRTQAAWRRQTKLRAPCQTQSPCFRAARLRPLLPLECCGPIERRCEPEWLREKNARGRRHYSFFPRVRELRLAAPSEVTLSKTASSARS